MSYLCFLKHGGLKNENGDGDAYATGAFKGELPELPEKHKHEHDMNIDISMSMEFRGLGEGEGVALRKNVAS